jgi:hypothetical protein
VRIDAGNALAVASSAYRTAFDPVRAARIATAFFAVPPPEPPATGGSEVVERDLPGPEGGSATYTWHDRNRDERYSSGDQFTIAFTDYGVDGRVLDGTAQFDDVAIEGDVTHGLAWILSADLQMLGLHCTSGATDTLLDGHFRCRREKRATVEMLSLEPESDVPVGTRTLHPGSDVARNDYVIDFSMGLFADGTFTDPLLGGTLAFRTDTPMTGIQFMADPSTGEFTVHGADGTTLTVVPIDFFTLEIQVDENGDGEVDVTIPAAWADL